MLPVYQAGSLPEAELLRQRLEEHGIASALRNVHLQGALGELPANLLPEVCVLDENDFERAREQVALMEAAARATLGPDRVCPHCGEENPENFELCWHCRCEI